MGGTCRICAILTALAAMLAAVPAAHAARSWNAPIELSAPGADAWIGKEVPQLAISPDGETLVAWRELKDGVFSVKAATKPAGGPLVGPDTLGGGGSPPSVTLTPGGRAYVAWVGNAAPGDRGETVFVSERQGGAWGSPVAVGDFAQGFDQPGTAVAANDEGDAVVLFSTGTWNNQQLWSSRRTREGKWLTPRPVSAPLGEAVWRLHAGMSATGEAVYAWLSWHGDGDNSAWTAIEPLDGAPGQVKRMHAPGNRSTMPALAVDAAGNAIATWVEQPPEQSVVVGEVRASVRAAGQPFGKSVALGHSGDGYPPQTRLTTAGTALVSWIPAVANGDYGASHGGLALAVGTVPGGAFAPTKVVTNDLVDTPISLAADPVGNAAFFFGDWDTGEQRVLRRSVAGVNGQQRAVVPACPRIRTFPLASGVDPAGNLSLLWLESNWAKGRASLFLSQDTASSGFSPDPCPRPPPILVWTPKDPAPGQSVSFDASGAREPDAARTEFAWDLDGDGSYETNTGASPTVQKTFGSAGAHTIGLKVTSYSQSSGNWGSWSMPLQIRVGTPPDPPNEYPQASGDPRPPDEPDEDPWPIAPAGAPPLPDLPELPIIGTLDPTQTAGLLQPASAGPGSVTQAGTPGGSLVVDVAQALRARTLMSEGVPVRLRPRRNGVVRLRLLAAARGGVTASVSSKTIAGPTTVRVRKRRATTLRLRLTAAGRRIVRRGNVKTVTLEVIAPDGSKLRQKIRVR